MWDVLKRLEEMMEPYEHPPTTIHFPDHDLAIQLSTTYLKGNELSYDDPQFDFDSSFLFDADEAILEYLRERDGDDQFRSQPDADEPEKIATGRIYLQVYANLAERFSFTKPTDLVIFEFGTTGTRMSMLFEDSTAIRRAFIALLEKFHGVTGIFNRGIDYGQLFWYKGNELDETVLSVHMLPDEIEEMLERGW